MDRDKALWVLRDMMTVKEAIDHLIEEPFSPRETMHLMDEVSKYIDKHSDIRALFDDESDYQIIEMALETYQRWIDQKIVAVLNDFDGSFRYVVTRWLGDSSLVVCAEPITQDQHEARKNYPYTDAVEPYRVSALLRLLR